MVEYTGEKQSHIFKFGALNNRHTPPAVLAAEIDPEWWIVAMNNPRFPVDVLKARLKRDPLLALELVNPELDLVRQLALNGKTRAIREQAMRNLMSCIDPQRNIS